ncbi:MAG: hypothetical protein HJJLKODD_01031 [Phycisphaerae bacterium]|nr:hypothetical protein [Phycisphaerae bacterium]
MQRVPRRGWQTVGWWCCCTAILGLGLTGCGGGGGNDNNGGGGTVSTSSCQSTSSDVIVQNDDNPDNDLIASSVSGGDCDQVAVFGENTGSLKQVAIATQNGEEIIIELDENGNPVAARDSDGGTTTFAYNDSLGYTRGTYEDGQGNSSTSTFTVDRESSARRYGQQNGTESLEFCNELQNLGVVLEGMVAECAAGSTRNFCSSPLVDAARASKELCDAQQVEEVDGFTDHEFSDTEEEFALGVDGYINTRPAANNGTTFIGSSVGYGGVPPYTTTWALLSGQTMELTQVPGGAMIGDSAESEGTFEFEVTITDSVGSTTTSQVVAVLGETLLIKASNTNPAVGEEITLEAIGANLPEDALYFWAFGDGDATLGQTVTHTYTGEESYLVTLLVVLNSDYELKASTEINVGGATGGQGLQVEIVADATTLTPGGTTELGYTVQGAVGNVYVGWDVVQGPGEVFDSESELSAQAAFGENPTLRALDEGIIQVVLYVADDTGRVAFDFKSFSACGSLGGLYAAFDGPYFVLTNSPVSLESIVVDCRAEESVSYEWLVSDEAGDISTLAKLDDASAASPIFLASAPGIYYPVLNVSAADGRSAIAYGFIFVTDCPFDGMCDSTCLGFDPDCGDYAEVCPEDGFCDPECPATDPDCVIEEFCTSGDGWCDFGCESPDIDCGATNEDICFNFYYCCDGDGWCDGSDCWTEDSDCAFCSEDGFCDDSCYYDPDCDDPFACDVTFDCDPDCPYDPDCYESCPQDGFCDEFCYDDPDCYFAECDLTFECDPDCPEDPDCFGNCEDDGICNTGCYFVEPFSGDPDCDNADICEATGGIEEFGYCCEFDDFCDSGCPEEDVDCGDSGHCDDGFCDSSIEDEFTCPEDCSTEAFCGDGFCDTEFGEDESTCPDDCSFVDEGCSEPVDCDDEIACTIEQCNAGECAWAVTSECGSTNEDICSTIFYCCEGDDFCDLDCPTTDVDCAG